MNNNKKKTTTSSLPAFGSICSKNIKWQIFGVIIWWDKHTRTQRCLSSCLLHAIISFAFCHRRMRFFHPTDILKETVIPIWFCPYFTFCLYTTILHTLSNILSSPPTMGRKESNSRLNLELEKFLEIVRCHFPIVLTWKLRPTG